MRVPASFPQLHHIENAWRQKPWLLSVRGVFGGSRRSERPLAHVLASHLGRLAIPPPCGWGSLFLWSDGEVRGAESESGRHEASSCPFLSRTPLSHRELIFLQTLIPIELWFSTGGRFDPQRTFVNVRDILDDHSWECYQHPVGRGQGSCWTFYKWPRQLPCHHHPLPHTHSKDLSKRQ